MLLAERGIVVSYETVRRWCQKFGESCAGCLRRRRPRPGDKWHLDEVFVPIRGVQHYLWRAVDQDGVALDILVQDRRNGKAANRFFKRLLKGMQCTASDNHRQAEVERGKNCTNSGVRAKVEHRIGVIKRVLGFTKARYRGLAKNTQRMWVVAVSPICSSPGINCDSRDRSTVSGIFAAESRTRRILPQPLCSRDQVLHRESMIRW